MTPNSSVFGHCVNFGLMRLNAFRWGCHSSIRRGPRTEHVRDLLQRKNILDSLCWRVLDCFSDQPVHIWLPRSVARKNNHRLARNPREPSDWQAVEGKKPKTRHAGGHWGDNWSRHRPPGPANHRLATRGDTWGDSWSRHRPPGSKNHRLTRKVLENPPTDKLLGEKQFCAKQI